MDKIDEEEEEALFNKSDDNDQSSVERD